MKITLIREEKESGKEAVSTCEADALLEKIKTETKAAHVTALRTMLLYTTPDARGHYEHIDKLPRIYPSIEYGRSRDGSRKMKHYNGVVMLEVNDLAGLPEVELVKEQARLLPQTWAAITGSSGRSVKIWVKFVLPDGSLPVKEENITLFHACAYRMAVQCYQPILSFPITLKEPSPTQSCRMTLDVTPYFNPDAIPFCQEQPFSMPGEQTFHQRKLMEKNPLRFAAKACEKGLRYDLTVPFARYVVQHRNEISFPFKRYQIQPVWRADRPQKGRYREFYQCDGDVVGSDSLINEVELIQIMDEVFHRFGIRVCIKMNNRKILSGIAEIIGEADKIVDITVAIDKLDKIGLDNVNEELRSKGLPEEAIERLQPIIMLQGSNQEKIATLKEVLSASETGLKGVAELDFILERISHTPIRAELELDLTLARGLNYYTGAIFEVKALDVQIGSITGGGRYDNLTGVFGMEGVSGVGFSFGADRIFDVLNQLDLYPEGSLKTTQLLFVNFGQKEEIHLLPLIAKVRKAGIRTELYPESTKMKKQMGYADAKKIPFVAIVGENEMAENKINLKNMLTGEQNLVTIEELIERF